MDMVLVLPEVGISVMKVERGQVLFLLRGPELFPAAEHVELIPQLVIRDQLKIKIVGFNHFSPQVILSEEKLLPGLQSPSRTLTAHSLRASSMFRTGYLAFSE